MFEELKKYILENLQNKVSEKGLNNYEIFGKEVETLISDLIEEFLQSKKIQYKAERARSKNDFPDLKLTIGDVEYAFEHKAGESSIGPNNDMGTLDAYSGKIEQFGDRIFCVFIKYSKATQDSGIIIEDVYIDKIYKFIGIFASSGRDDILKYRKKDGNLRPKVWNDFDQEKIYIENLEDFENDINKTKSYRSTQLVLQHMENLTDEDKVELYNQLKVRIENTDQ